MEVRFVELEGPQGLEDREGVADARLLAHGGDHVDVVAALPEGLVQGAQAWGADAVVVGDEYVHGAVGDKELPVDGAMPCLNPRPGLSCRRRRDN